MCQWNTPPKTLPTYGGFINCKFACCLNLCCCWLFSLLDWPSQIDVLSLQTYNGLQKNAHITFNGESGRGARPARRGAHLPDPLPDQRLQVPPRRELPEQFAVSAGEQTVRVPRRSTRQHNNDTRRSVRSARRQWRPAGGIRGGSAAAAAGYGTREYYDEWLELNR